MSRSKVAEGVGTAPRAQNDVIGRICARKAAFPAILRLREQNRPIYVIFTVIAPFPRRSGPPIPHSGTLLATSPSGALPTPIDLHNIGAGLIWESEAQFLGHFDQTSLELAEIEVNLDKFITKAFSVLIRRISSQLIENVSSLRQKIIDVGPRSLLVTRFAHFPPHVTYDLAYTGCTVYT